MVFPANGFSQEIYSAWADAVVGTGLQHGILRLELICVKNWRFQLNFGFRASVPGYQMEVI